jgi:hypothetical protein
MRKLSDPDLPFLVPQSAVMQTLAFLQSQGELLHEGVALWAGTIIDAGFQVEHVIIPEQYTSPVSFRIPNEEMFRLLRWASERDVVFGVQVHSHPEDAFHSQADDEHCILQHRGAISIVVPGCGNVAVQEFFRRAAVYTLHQNNDWRLLPYEIVMARFLVEKL